jgi:hypothetical protein
MNNAKLRQRLILAATVLVVALLAVTTVTVAQPPAPAAETDGAETASLSAVSYDSATSTGLPPDENPPAGVAGAPGAPQQLFRYYQVSGATLRGRNSTTGYAYDGLGCSFVTAGTGAGRILNTELPLPDGAVIKYLRVYYNDTNALNGVEGYITRYQPGTGTADLIHTGSSDAFAGGYGFVVSAEITETVTNVPYAYTLIGWPDAVGSANQICGLRVAYYPAVAAAFLPLTIK